MHCTNCAAEIPVQRKYCGRCGAAVVRRCLACGMANPALNRFCGECGTRLRVDSPVMIPGLHGTLRPIERRQLTVLFCDLVGSIALSAELDPEDFGAIIAGYRRCITETVASFGGFVARHHGDGAVVYFGYPHAHEDDAERAVQAGLALVQAVAALPTREADARVGVATGVALVGDMSDSAISEEHGILGDTPNFAARLQSLAQPGSVIISGRTKTMAGPQFEYLDLGNVEIKGFARPVAAWQCAGQPLTSRSHALQRRDLLPLIGRDDEIELLLRRWERARSGEGQVVLLSGEAGIGNRGFPSRWWNSLHASRTSACGSFCSPQHTDSTLYPVIGEMFPRAAGFAHDDNQQTKPGQARRAAGAKRRRLRKMPRCLPKCCRCPTTDVTLSVEVEAAAPPRRKR